MRRKMFILLLLVFAAATMYSQNCGDVNLDGAIDIIDALLIAQYYVGIIDESYLCPMVTPAPTVIPDMAMTWEKMSHDPELEIDLVGCSGCDAYNGDTPISEEHPVLAIKYENLPRPNYAITGDGAAMPPEYYQGWAGGTIKLTPPIKGELLTSLQVANDYCAQHCGPGYRMAEFHDGKYILGMDKDVYYGETWPLPGQLSSGAWNFYAHGNIPDNTRFWVYINDQNANCWDSIPDTTPAPAPDMAVTWEKKSHDPELEIDIVGCSGCDAYNGDTPISEEHPVLAIKYENLPRPNYAITGDGAAMPPEYYQGWAGGTIKLTPPIKGELLTSLQVANDYCAQHCGPGYRMAEFHDGKYILGMDKDAYYGETWPLPGQLSSGAWNFYANGNIPDNTRFWVYINDQNANCWD